MEKCFTAAYQNSSIDYSPELKLQFDIYSPAFNEGFLSFEIFQFDKIWNSWTETSAWYRLYA